MSIPLTNFRVRHLKCNVSSQFLPNFSCTYAIPVKAIMSIPPTVQDENRGMESARILRYREANCTMRISISEYGNKQSRYILRHIPCYHRPVSPDSAVFQNAISRLSETARLFRPTDARRTRPQTILRLLFPLTQITNIEHNKLPY